MMTNNFWRTAGQQGLHPSLRLPSSQPFGGMKQHTGVNGIDVLNGTNSACSGWSVGHLKSRPCDNCQSYSIPQRNARSGLVRGIGKRTDSDSPLVRLIIGIKVLGFLLGRVVEMVASLPQSCRFTIGQACRPVGKFYADAGSTPATSTIF